MFTGKRALVLGVANKRSIAWAIAKRLADGGAELAFTFQGERIEKNVRELADSVGGKLVTELDVRDDSARSRTDFSMRSPWYVKASSAPPAARRCAIAHAIERLLATPRTSPVFPLKSCTARRV